MPAKWTVSSGRDNRDAGDLLAELVRSLGHYAEAAYDGPQALELSEKAGAHLAILNVLKCAVKQEGGY